MGLAEALLMSVEGVVDISQRAQLDVLSASPQLPPHKPVMLITRVPELKLLTVPGHVISGDALFRKASASATPDCLG